MSIATDSNTATPDPADIAPESAVERALAAAIEDASRIGDLLDVLRRARLWLPLPGGGSAAIKGTAVTLPTVCYLGSEFVPAYSSVQLLRQLASAGTASTAPTATTASAAAPAETVPHVVVRAADLARLLPPSVGIALNAGASESVPVYPQGVSYLAAQDAGNELDRISVGPLPIRPDGLLADIAAGLVQIAQVRDASAAWLSVRFAGEGLLISVTLDDPAETAARDLAVGAIERAAWQAAAQDAAFPIDVTFPGESEPDHIDEWISAFATPFYRRA
ncbi:MAG TPA: SseB family protein [Streptosporangiaceae bacterium]|nr:SseB family protein [Streptosporangiaceae bacterium]